MNGVNNKLHSAEELVNQKLERKIWNKALSGKRVENEIIGMRHRNIERRYNTCVLKPSKERRERLGEKHKLKKQWP